MNAQTLTLIGRCFFGLALIGSGILQWITHQFVRLVPKPPSIPPTLWPGVFGAFLVIAGLMILLRRGERLAGIAVSVVLLASFLFQHVPAILAAPQLGYVWTNPCKVLALAAGVIVVTRSLHEEMFGQRSGSLLSGGLALAMGGVALGVFLLVCGVQHFVYVDFVETLVPSWAGHPRVWTYITGSALVAGGVGLMLPRTARWAALLAGGMVFLWVLLLHIPRAVAGPERAMETAGIFEALAISGVGFSLAGFWWRKVASGCKQTKTRSDQYGKL